MQMILLTKANGTKFIIPADSISDVDNQARGSTDPSYWLKQTNGINWSIKESPEEVLKLLEALCTS